MQSKQNAHSLLSIVLWIQFAYRYTFICTYQLGLVLPADLFHPVHPFILNDWNMYQCFILILVEKYIQNLKHIKTIIQSIQIIIVYKYYLTPFHEFTSMMIVIWEFV